LFSFIFVISFFLIQKLKKLFGKLEKLVRPERHKATRPEAQKFIAQGNARKQHALKGQKLLAQGSARKQHALKGQKLLAQGSARKQHAPEGAEALSPGQRPGLACSQTCRPVRAKALKLQGQFVKLLPLQGDLLIAFIPRALPWGKSFCPFRACCLVNTPTKAYVLTPLTP
jgi:hypothetical protein